METLDADRLRSSYNGYMSNFSKQDAEGNMYAIYQCEPIISGAYSEAKDISRRFAIGFPKTKDSTLSRYVYARGYETWLACSALFADGSMLNAKKESGIIVSRAPYFDKLYIEQICEPVVIAAENDIAVYSTQPLTCTKGEIIQNNTFCFVVKPAPDKEIILTPILN